MKLFQETWQKLSVRGVDANLSEPEKKRELLFNRFLLMSVVVWVVEFFVICFAWLKQYGDSIYFVPNVAIAVAIPLIYLARTKLPSQLLQFLTFFILLGHGVAIALFLGKEYEYHTFIIVFVFSPFFVATRKSGIYIAAAILTTFIYIGMYIWFEFHSGLFTPNPTIFLYIKYTSIVVIGFMVLSLAYSMWHYSTGAEFALELEREKSEKLLLNVLPAEIARELREAGKVEPRFYPEVGILFTDFCGFTSVAEKMSPAELVRELDQCFSYFDAVVTRMGIEKLKTIGDAYMCASGLPLPDAAHLYKLLLAALEIRAFMAQMKRLRLEKNLPYWELRIGIHCGPVIAGVIGEQKFAYDIWGDTVNTAARFESSGVPGKINVSAAIEQKTRHVFCFSHRGKIAAKNKGDIDMYFLEKIRPEFSISPDGEVPNLKFLALLGGVVQ